MSRFTDEQIIAAADNWKAWGKQFGWTLRGIGDTFHDESALCSFVREVDGPNAVSFNITAAVRADIDAALAKKS